MSEVRIFHNPRCSKSRQTLTLLQENGVDATVIEYLKTPPTTEQLKEIIQQLGIEPRALLRKTESDYKTLNLANKSLSDEQLVEAMASHPKLIERPIVIKNGIARIGRPPESVLEII